MLFFNILQCTKAYSSSQALEFAFFHFLERIFLNMMRNLWQRNRMVPRLNLLVKV